MSPLQVALTVSAVAIAVGLLVLLAGLQMPEVVFVRGLLCVGILGALWILFLVSPRTALCGMLLFLSVLGGLRRSLIPFLGWPPQDPLLLVGPATVLVVFVILFATRRIKINTGLSRLVYIVTALMALEMFNPAQGGLAVGLAGALFYIIPVLWFFVGRVLCDQNALNLLYKVTIAIAVAAVLYGLFQTFFGFSQTDKDWIKISGMWALYVGGTVRAISFYTSPAEYVWVLSIAIVLLWARFIKGSLAALIPIPLLATGVFLESGRGPVVTTLISITILWAIQARERKAWITRGIIAGVCVVCGLMYSLQQLQTVHMSSNVSSLVQHQVTGILDPDNPGASTASIHAMMLLGGVATGFMKPLGDGLGATTLAAGKLGGEATSSESDYANMFISLGFVGGLLYVVVIITVLATALRNWVAYRNLVSLSIVGVLFLQIGLWLQGEQYSTVFLVWTSIGALDRMLPQPIGKVKQRFLQPAMPTPALAAQLNAEPAQQ